MSKWNLNGSSGISIGGEFYVADIEGNVTVPDNVGGLAEYGFTLVLDVPAISAKIAAANDAAAAQAQAITDAANAAASSAINSAAAQAAAVAPTTADATVAAAVAANAPAAA